MRTVTFEVTEPFNWKEISTEIEDYFLKNYGKELFVRIREYDTSHLTKRNEIMKCIECGTDIVLPNDVMENELIDCDGCGIELEVISPNPFKFDLAPEEQEDWGE